MELNPQKFKHLWISLHECSNFCGFSQASAVTESPQLWGVSVAYSNQIRTRSGDIKAQQVYNCWGKSKSHYVIISDCQDTNFFLFKEKKTKKSFL